MGEPRSASCTDGGLGQQVVRAGDGHRRPVDPEVRRPRPVTDDQVPRAVPMRRPAATPAARRRVDGAVAAGRRPRRVRTRPPRPGSRRSGSGAVLSLERRRPWRRHRRAQPAMTSAAASPPTPPCRIRPPRPAPRLPASALRCGRAGLTLTITARSTVDRPSVRVVGLRSAKAHPNPVRRRQAGQRSHARNPRPGTGSDHARATPAGRPVARTPTDRARNPSRSVPPAAGGAAAPSL